METRTPEFKPEEDAISIPAVETAEEEDLYDKSTTSPLYRAANEENYAFIEEACKNKSDLIRLHSIRGLCNIFEILLDAKREDLVTALLNTDPSNLRTLCLLELLSQSLPFDKELK